MRTAYKIRELLLPGNWCAERARELLEEAEEELSAPPPEPEIMDCDCDQPAPPTAEDYVRLKDRKLFMEIGGVRVVWEAIHGAGPVRATIWIDGETWLEHVKILQPGGQP